MNTGRFFLPNFSPQMNPMFASRYLPASLHRMGFLGRITNSIKSFNWSGLINGANKTLNVVNQSIPLVRQAGPMLNNMKSMFRIAKAFGSETTNVKIQNQTKQSTNKNTPSDTNKVIQKAKISYNNYPSFFV